MATVGQYLKETREGKGLSFKDVEAGTSIRALYIEAIETGAYETVPGEVYLKGFIRNYANFLGLDGAALVRRYKEEQGLLSAAPTAAEAPPAQAVQEPAAAPAARTSAPRAGGKTMAVLRLTAILAAVLTAAGAAWWAVGLVPKTAPPAATTAPVTAPQALPPASALPVALSAVFQDSCWAEVRVDGKEVFSGTVQKGQQLRWEGHTSVRLTLGNAGAVQLAFNGAPQPPLGRTGEVVEYEFTPQGALKK